MYPSWSMFPVWAVQHYDDVLWRGGRPCLLALRGANQATACKESTFELSKACIHLGIHVFRPVREESDPIYGCDHRKSYPNSKPYNHDAR